MKRYLFVAASLLVAGAAKSANAPLVFDLRPTQATVVTAPPKPVASKAAVAKAPSAKAAPAHPAPPKPSAKKIRLASAATGNTLVGRIGTVLYNNVPIFDGPYQRKVYAYCGTGQTVLLTGWNSQWYGVRMIDGRTGWVYRGYVNLLPTAIRIPQTAPHGQEPAPSLDPNSFAPLLRTAAQYIGIPYRWGGTSASGIDCSGFVRSVFRQYGVELPRVARDQAKVGLPVPLTPSALRPGDRLYFACHHSYIDHTGIYCGYGMFIHSSGGRGVGISPLWDGGIYEKGLVSVRRTFSNMTARR